MCKPGAQNLANDLNDRRIFAGLWKGTVNVGRALLRRAQQKRLIPLHHVSGVVIGGAAKEPVDAFGDLARRHP